MTTWLAVTRFAHISACLLLFGLVFFDRFLAPAAAAPKVRAYWQLCDSVIRWILLPVILISGIGWFALTAKMMSGQPLDTSVLKVVWGQTEFGHLWKIRILFWGAALVLSFFQRPKAESREFAAWVMALAAGCMAASLAWTGHGREISRWHLAADVLHLLGAGIWPMGLLPLLLLLRKARRIAGPEDWPALAALVNRFSTISLAVVSLMIITGTVNAWFLVGSFSNLVSKPYGHWLLAKLGLFCAALAVAAVNWLRLRPCLAAEQAQPARAMA
ncbi:MAG: CopD family protein, partial [Limisphaerales bacterium]